MTLPLIKSLTRFVVETDLSKLDIYDAYNLWADATDTTLTQQQDVEWVVKYMSDLINIKATPLIVLLS